MILGLYCLILTIEYILEKLRGLVVKLLFGNFKSCIFFCCNHDYSLRKLGQRHPYKNAAIRKENATLHFFKNLRLLDQKFTRYVEVLEVLLFLGSRKNLITICLPWGCEKLPVETKRATVKSHLSSIIMAAWNWVLESFQNIALQKKVPYQIPEYWFVEYGTSESSK